MTSFIKRAATGAACFVAGAYAAYPARNHCQVPCGIYDDGRRFEELKEDARSVAKAVSEINGHAEQVSFGGNKEAVAYHMNQSVRWIDTKEESAQNIQKTVAEYFLTQKVKDVARGEEGYFEYLEKLAVHHRLMRRAMDAKQRADATTAKKLTEAILELEAVYGKCDC